MSSFYSENELKQLGFKRLGENVLISRNTCIYKANEIEIGDHVRIDDFCFLLGKIRIGSYVHIAPYSNLVGGSEGVVMEDFSGVSSRVSIYAVSDDYSGKAMTNPTVPEKYTNVQAKAVYIKRHAIVGASSVILPGVTVEEGTSCGSMSLINKSTEPWGVYVGIPAKKIAERDRAVLDMEKRFCADLEEQKKRCKHSMKKIVTAELIDRFAEVSGDVNPIHLCEEYAKKSVFGHRIAHGMLTASFISAVIGNYFPGNGTIYLSQNLKFLRPVSVGDEIVVTVEIENVEDNGRALLTTNVTNNYGEQVVSGNAYVKLPEGFKV